jgi:hypothetical protein
MKLNKVVDILSKLHSSRDDSAPPFPEYLEIVSAREQVMQNFQPKLRAVDGLKEDTFREFLSFKANRHWTGLQRPTKHTCDDMDRLRRGLNRLFDESIDISVRLDSLANGKEYSITGLGIGILSPLLLIRFPDKYGVWNGKSEAALKALKLWPAFERGSTDGQRYKILNDLYLELADRIGIDLWCLDGLWHVINEKSKADSDRAFEQFLQDEKDFYEGRRVENTGYRIERSSKARNECINIHGLDCKVCQLNFFEVYGEIGLRFIHVHHVNDISGQPENYKVDPKKDLVPVCPNCHAMLHQGSTPARSVDELKAIMKEAKLN